MEKSNQVDCYYYQNKPIASIRVYFNNLEEIISSNVVKLYSDTALDIDKFLDDLKDVVSSIKMTLRYQSNKCYVIEFSCFPDVAMSVCLLDELKVLPYGACEFLKQGMILALHKFVSEQYDEMKNSFSKSLSESATIAKIILSDIKLKTYRVINRFSSISAETVKDIKSADLKVAYEELLEEPQWTFYCLAETVYELFYSGYTSVGLRFESYLWSTNNIIISKQGLLKEKEGEFNKKLIYCKLVKITYEALKNIRILEDRVLLVKEDVDSCWYKLARQVAF